MPDAVYHLKLHGPFSFSLEGGAPFELGLKQQALIALLATSNDGQRTRAWLQDMLWGNVQPAQSKGSLRNALSQTRKVIGARGDDVLRATRDRAILDLGRVRLVGGPDEGDFLEGLDLRHETAFAVWLSERRAELASRPRGGARVEPPPPAATVYAAPHSAALPARQPHAPLSRHVERAAELLPVIAVLPFREREDAGASGFGDALAEDVSRAFARSGVFTVISHLSCRHYGGRQATLQQVSAELNAQFVVTGQVAGADGRFHVDIDIHHRPTEKLLDSRRHHGTIEAFFQGEMDLGRAVVARAARCAREMAVSSASRGMGGAPLPSLAVHEMLMAATQMMHGSDQDRFMFAKRMLDAAVERAPGRAPLHAWRGKWHVLKVMRGFGEDRVAEAQQALDETGRALDLDPTSSVALAFDGFVHSHLASAVDLAETRFRQAIEADPNDAFAWLMFGAVHAFRNQSADAVRFTERARLLSPLDPQKQYFDTLSATAYLADGAFAEALEMANRAMAASRRGGSTQRVRVIALVRLGRIEEARQAAAELLRIDPGLTVSGYLADHPAGDFPAGRDWAAALAEAGVPV